MNPHALLLATLLCISAARAAPAQALTGDLDCDGRVDLTDFFVFADRFGNEGASGCALEADLDCDGRVDLTDFFLFADHFGSEGAAGCGAEEEPLSFGTPRTFSELLDESRAVVWTPRGLPPADLARIGLGVEATQDLLLVDDDAGGGGAALTVAAGLAASTTLSNDTLLRSMLKLIEVSTDTFMLVSAKHSNYAVDRDAVDGALALRDYRSYYRDAATTGYLRFTFKPSGSGMRITAAGRDAYSAAAGDFASDPSWTPMEVAVSGDRARLTAGTGTLFTVYDPPLDQQIPFDFNPAAVERVVNDEYLPTYDGADRLLQSIGQVMAAYADQVAAPGPDAGTTAAALAMLATIEADLAAEGAFLRYPVELYQAVRANLLARAVYVSDTFDAVIGRPTIPYVYFTNETADDGLHHPFMVIASYGVPEGMTHLWDIPRPPGDGAPGTRYPEQQVTRNALSMAYFAKVPMRDYGEVETLTDNAMVADLASDAGSGDLTAFSYASVSATGIALDGVVVYPSLNNTLEFAQAAGEISRLGHHSGRGLGAHYHADSYGPTMSGLDLYNPQDYEGRSHPPVVTLGFDGVAGYGRYLAGDTASEGADLALDAWGGHRHGPYAYHYHAEALPQVAAAPGAQGVAYTAHTLPPKGAWRGRIGSIPGFWDGTAPAFGGRPDEYAGVAAPPAR